MRSNNRNWSLVAGVLIVLAACVLSYVLTKPAEADASIPQDVFMGYVVKNA